LRTQRVETKSAASRRYFYALLDEEGNRNNRIEGFLARVETYAAVALRAKLSAPASNRATVLSSKPNPFGDPT